MNVYIYSDESGVFDRNHYRNYVFGGIVFFNKDSREDISRKYIGVEREIRAQNNISRSTEIKASILEVSDKRRLWGVLRNVYKFGAVVRCEKVLDHVWKSKKDKQRFLDYV